MPPSPSDPALSHLREAMVQVARTAGIGSRKLTPEGCFAKEVWAPWLRLGHPRSAVILDDLFCDTLSAKWEHGWQPAEVARAVRRERGPIHSDLIATAIASDHARRGRRPPAEWAGQLADLGADITWWGSGCDWLPSWAARTGTPLDRAVATALEALGTVLWLPHVGHVLPPPSRWGGTGSMAAERGIDQAVLARVRALLAKAESTTFEAEADAFTAKAQQLMARHAIDEALARRPPPDSQTGRGRASASGGAGPIVRRVPVDEPYASAKFTLVNAVAGANGVSAIWNRGLALISIIGFRTDVEAVELLYTSLLVQASKSLLTAGSVRDRDGRSCTRSFRQSFYVAFAYRIGERLREAAARARDEARQESRRDVLPVLAARQDQVDAVTAELFPLIRRTRGPSITNSSGYAAGRAAADRARLTPDRAFLHRAG